MYINIRIVLGCEVTALSINKIGLNNYGVSFKGANLNSAPRKVQGAVEKLVEKAAEPIVNVVAAPKSKLELLLLNNMDIGASIKSYEQIMQEAGEINKAVKDGNKVKLKKIMDKNYAKNTGEAAPLAKANEEAPLSLKEAIRHLQIERDSYKNVVSGIDEKLIELEAQKAKLLEQSCLAKKVTHKREKIQQFLNPEKYNQKEIAIAERDVALSPEKQQELADAQKELTDLKILNNVLLKTRDAESENFSKNAKEMAALKLKVQKLEDSLTPKAIMQKELIAAQKEFRDLRAENKLLRKKKDTEPENFSKNVKAMEESQRKIRALKDSLTPEALKQNKNSLGEQGITIPIDKQKELADSQKKLGDLEALNQELSMQKDAAQDKLSQNISAIAEQKLKIEELENSKTLTPEALKKKETLLAQRQALVDFNGKTVEELEQDKRPWTQSMLKALTPEGGIVSKQVTGSDLLKLKLESLKAEEAKTPSVDRQIRAINLDILEFGKEHQAYTANIEQIERRIEVLGFEKDKAARGIEETVETPVVLPKKKKNPTNIEKQKRNMTLDEKRQASLERKEKIKERKAQYREEVSQKTNTLTNEIKELKGDLVSYEYEIRSMSKELEKANNQREKLVKKSPFVKAEEVRTVSLNTIKRLMNETEKEVTQQQKEALSKKATAIPSKDNFSSIKEFRRALRKIFKAKQRLEGAKQKEVKNNLVEVPNVRLQRQIITESNAQYPNIKTITQRIDQVKKFLSPESFNQKELSYVEYEIVSEQKQELLDTQTLLSELKAANEVLKPFTGYIKQEKGKTVFVEFDYDAKMAEMVEREPKVHQFTTEKNFKKNLESWKASKAELEAKKAKAEIFNKNEEEIKKCEQRIAQLEAEKMLTPQAAKQKEILLAQKQAVVDFNNNTIRQSRKNKNPFKNAILGELSAKDRKKVRVTKMTGHELLELRLKELEAKKQELIDSDKKIWNLSTSISQWISDRDLLNTKANIAQKHIKELENQKLSLQKESKSKQKRIAHEPV